MKVLFTNNKSFAFHRLALGIAGALPLLAGPQYASAQDAQPAIEELVVSGSRIQRDGYTAPTPVTVLDVESLQSVAPVHVGESLMLMPQFATSSQPTTGVVYANLRSIGEERTLFLLNGRRHVPTFSSGVVDLSTIPTSLVSRAEIVTGGASASWGSDAVAGVVNLVLKDNLEGVEVSAQAGQSRYKDDESVSVSIAGGSNFADGRGHVLVGAEYADAKGIGGYGRPDIARPEYGARQSVTNSDYTRGPQFIYANDVRRSTVYEGGLITSGPLAGTTFEPNGKTGRFQYGDVYNTFMIGGGSNEWVTADGGGDLKSPIERKAFLARVNYDLTPNIGTTLEFNYSSALSEGLSILPRTSGSTATNRGCTFTGYSSATQPTGNLNVSIDNAFLPESVRQAMVDARINCFNFGREYYEPGMGVVGTAEGSPHIYRYVVGFDGELANDWTWDAYVQYGDSSFQQRRFRNVHTQKFGNAMDAVRDPATNQIVCRINIDSNPANNDSNCRPFNLFGYGSPSPEAISYITGTSRLDQSIEQTVAAVSTQGTVFEGWAGPITLATGAEYRKEEIHATVDPDSDMNAWATSNRKGIDGEYDVKEIFTEFAIPLVTDAPLAESVELSLAARGTRYSSSGDEVTWKVGTTWDVNEQLRFRASQSRDIRAGNLGELYTPTAVSIQLVTNPATSLTNTIRVTTTGNPRLAPETADTTTFGVVFSPNAIERFQTSLDYYEIEIEGQIGSLTAQQMANQCFIQKVQFACERFSVDSNGIITALENSFLNIDYFKTSGVDISTSYNFDIAEGNLALRLLSTYVHEHVVTFLRDGSTDDQAGEFSNPHWKAFLKADYTIGNFGVGVDWRWYGGGKIDNNRIEGFWGPQGANINNLPSVHYTSLNLQYDVTSLISDRGGEGNVFLRVDNLFDQGAPFPLRNVFNGNNGRGYRLGVNLSF